MNIDELILISIDDHICEPPDMFDRHVPQRYRELAPRVITDKDGAQQWWYGDLKGRATGLNACAGKPREFFNVDAASYEEMRPGCYDVHERVRDMSAGGQLAGLNFPNWTGFAGQVLNYGPDIETNDVMIRAYNDWHVDEWCGTYPERFIPCGIVPFCDVDRAAAEVRRLARKGCHAVTFSENPDALNLPSLHTDYWDPFLGACADEGTVICCHVGSSSRSTTTSPDAPVSVPASLAPLLSVFTFADLIWSSIWSRFPSLRVALTEGDIGWMPYFIDRFEHVQERHSGWTHQEFPDGSGPQEVFRSHILCCFINDRVGIELLNRFNVDNICWESDFPHSDSSWPNAPETLVEVLVGVEKDVIAKITHENAMTHFQFNPFEIRGKERCTVAALRSEAADVDVVTRVGKAAGDDSPERWLRAFRAREASAR